MSIDNKLHAILLVAFAALVSVALWTSAMDDAAEGAVLAEVTRVASSGGASDASR